MALVAYDNSDSEFDDDDSEEAVTVAPVASKTNVTEPGPSQSHTNGIVEDNQPLFNLLPRPSTKKPAVIEEDDEFLHKKAIPKDVVKPKAKITVPSLSDFKDVEDKPASKSRVASDKKSGLLSILPQPRNAGVTKSNTSLVPNVLTKKPLVPTTVKKKGPLPTPAKKTKTETKALVTSYSDESDNDDDESTDFFSINKPIELPVDDGPLDIDLPTQPATEESKVSKLESYFKKDVPQHMELEPDYPEPTDEYSNEEASSSYNSQTAVENTAGDKVELDEEAIRQLCGARGKRKREEIQIVEFNQQEVLADAREWLIKGLMDDTTKRVSSSKKTGHEPTSQQKRKHQITYLAHKAKANEAELQNQWANSRMSRRQTQSKYGF